MKNTQLEKECDALLTDIYQQLIGLQEKYKTEGVVEEIGTDEEGNPVTRETVRNRYFQLCDTHEVVPADGIQAAPDEGKMKPTDQKETLADFGFILPDTMPCSIALSTYQDLEGWGWVLTARVNDGGTIYTCAKNYGHLKEREFSWTKEATIT